MIRRAELAAIWRARLEEGAARTPLDSPGGDRWLLTWALACGVVGVLLFLAGGYEAGFLTLNAAAAVYPSGLWQHLTVLGDERVAFALALLFSGRYPRLFWSLILAALIAILLSRGLKVLFDTARPPAVLAADLFHLIGPAYQRTSFPSGHSVTAGCFFGVLIYHARWMEWRTLLLLVAVLVGLSRIAVGVHWPVDVAAGLALGALAAWLGGRLSARWPRPATRPSVHLPFVLLGVLMAVSLLFAHGGYPAAAPALRLLGLAAITNVLVGYLLSPLLFERRGG